jgi:Fur family peroxide stress response transcriptional regulator
MMIWWGKIPSLSKTTVYNTLKLFVEKDLVEEITIEGTEKRYDLYNPDSHAHFRCSSCGKLFDITLQIRQHESPDLDGFTIHRQSVHFTGLCPQCSRIM